MSVITFRKGTRRPGPEMPEGELSIQEPPTLPEVQRSAGAVMMYLPMALSSTATVLLFVRPGENGAFSYLAAGLMTVSSMAMLVGQLGRSAGERKQKLNDARRDYLRYLAQSRRKVREVVTSQREALAWRHPDPTSLWSLPGTTRMWERDAQDDDFGEIRVARGPQRLAWRLNPLSTKPVDDLEPLSAHALRRFIHAYGTVTDQPVAVFLPSFARILVQATAEEGERIRALARSMIAHIAVFHSPAELRIVVLAAPERRASWEWVKWLPHNLHPSETDGAGEARLVVESIAELETAMGDEFATRPGFDPDALPDLHEPCVMLFVDGVTMPPTNRLAGDGYRNTTVVDLSSALSVQDDPLTLRLRLGDGMLKLITVDQHNKEVAGDLGRPDGIGLNTATALAMRLAPYRVGARQKSAEPMAANFDLTAMLGITDIQTYDVAAGWAAKRPGGRLRVPLGVGPTGTTVDLDIKESAQSGMGPHGMLIGATGSGKSELLRTLVLALALTHSSEVLNFVLVDFKGGATFLGLDGLPHTSAVITNLADEAALVGRMREALNGELVRRQELLRKAGNYSSALDYERARANGTPLDPLPTLFLVVDEFSELLSAHRDFMDLFIMIGRLGRSLGVHLLLASQRLDESRIHQLESHLSYRIGLRTFSAMESRGVLGVPDAYQLPSDPGNGFLKSGTAALDRFKAAYVSGPHRVVRRNVEQAVVAQQIVPFTSKFAARTEPMPEPEPVVAEPEPEGSVPSLLELAVDRLRDAGPPAHEVWLPPLDAPSSLDELLPPLVETREHGLTAQEWYGRGGLTVPIGLIDRPFEQSRDPLLVNLAGSDGHVAIVGGPQSGKSTALRTLITALALTHTPAEIQFYCLDFGGGTLTSLRKLPHVGGVTGRLDVERIQRTIGEVTTLLTRRERFFTDNDIDSMATYRRKRAAGEYADQRHGDVFLVVDGWSTIRQDFMDLLPTFVELASRGLNYGIHLMMASSRWSEIVSAVRDLVGTQLELRLGDAVDSVINMRAAATVPKIPGRGLTDKELHFLTALPSIDGVERDVAEHVEALVDRIASAWSGPSAPPVRMLPPVLDRTELPEPDADMRLALGMDDQRLEPLWHDFEDNPHLMVIGDVESGKTNLLRLVIDGITKRYTPQEARIITVDYRRGLYDAVPQEYQLGYAVSGDSVHDMIDGVARAVQTRTPGPDITPARLRLRDWWTGPQVFVVIDDYDMVASSSNSLFQQLFDPLAQGNALGLHLVVARGANGIGRGANDPLLRRLVEVNTPMMLLSCPLSEGIVFGEVRPRVLIPGRAQYATRRGTTIVQTALSAHEAALVTK
ncbi:type VII secretion protein EccCa [Amycolatopsis sp. WAC 01416]|uniref:type VII secretion protein EccCa n=1 Tax=Amycolatopsis sp. WAC 01416 TaxID=2203196 RepID=UPI001F2B1BB5|nr:type VII secretion protein EccCa [Amycolatopsis sp. WAC 01416]